MGLPERISDSTLSTEERRLLLDAYKAEVESRKVELDSSFARKWFPTIATVIAGLVAGFFSLVQQQNALEATRQTQIRADSAADLAQASAKADADRETLRKEREWGFKIIEMYFTKGELFDITKNSEAAERNLKALSSVAPDVVRGLLVAEIDRIPRSSPAGSEHREDSLAAAARVQTAIQAGGPMVVAQANTWSQAQAPTVGSSPRLGSAPAPNSAQAPIQTPAPAGPRAEAGPSPADFTVYVQFRDDRALAGRVAANLRTAGFRAPAVDAQDNTPDNLQVRYYKPDQKPFAERLAAQLAQDFNLPNAAASQVVSKKELPAGILEVWLPR
jgi:hypothetical protein